MYVCSFIYQLVWHITFTHGYPPHCATYRPVIVIQNAIHHPNQLFLFFSPHPFSPISPISFSIIHLPSPKYPRTPSIPIPLPITLPITLPIPSFYPLPKLSHLKYLFTPLIRIYPTFSSPHHRPIPPSLPPITHTHMRRGVVP